MIIFDLLYNEKDAYLLADLMNKIDKEYLSNFEDPMAFDESILRKRLKEYIEEGIIVSEKRGKHLIYRRAKDVKIDNIYDVIDFFRDIAVRCERLFFTR